MSGARVAAALDRLLFAEDCKGLHAQAQRLAGALAVTSARGPDNYAVVFRDDDARWREVERGTREFCIGYAEGASLHVDGVDVYRVAVGDVFVWPESAAGEPVVCRSPDGKLVGQR